MIYYWRTKASQIYFFSIFAKGAKTNLTAAEKKQLKQAAEALK